MAAERSPPQGSALWSPDALAAFRRGDSAKLTAIYRDHVDVIARMLRDGFTFSSGDQTIRFTGLRSASDQQDLLQETFVRAFSPSARANYDGVTPFVAYLRGIARNLVIDHLRAQKRAALEPLTEAHEGAHVVVVDDDAGAAIDDEALRAFVATFEGSLPVLEQRFVAVRYGQGLTQLETAARLGVGRSRVRTLEQRVRGRLLKRLAGAGYVDARHAHPLRALLSALSALWLWNVLQEVL